MEHITVFETKNAVISLGELIVELTKLQELHGSECAVFKKNKTESVGINKINKREVDWDKKGTMRFNIQLV